MSIQLAYEPATPEERLGNLWIHRPGSLAEQLPRFVEHPQVAPLLARPPRNWAITAFHCG